MNISTSLSSFVIIKTAKNAITIFKALDISVSWKQEAEKQTEELMKNVNSITVINNAVDFTFN